jgi:hypothetical protein
MHLRLLLLAALITASATPALAVDAPAPKPLRTLVYAIDYGGVDVRREQSAGFGAAVGHGITERNRDIDEHGKLTVVVIAATQDGGLVADISYAGSSTVQDTVRVAIFSDGRLSYDPKTPLCLEAATLVPYLARGFAADHTIEAGQSWKAAEAPPATGTTTYTVKSVDGTHAEIDILATVAMTGPSGFSEQETGKTSYAVNVQAPLTLDLEIINQREISISETDNTRAHFAAKLVSDTFPGH